LILHFDNRPAIYESNEIVPLLANNNCMSKIKVPEFLRKYKQSCIKLKQICFEINPQKTALALTLGICVGIIPFLGVTLITITLLGFVFRLNQIILQTTHLLVSPFQILFIPLFLKAGQWLFAPSESHIIHDSPSLIHMNFLQMINQFGHLILYGLIVWLIFSVIAGFLLYRFLLKVLPLQVKAKEV
jgi:uncharacterized protein (DUF2062 family)